MEFSGHYKKDKPKDEKKGSEPKTMHEKHSHEHGEMHKRHMSAHDDMHKMHQKERDDMAMRHEAEMAQGDQGGAPAPQQAPAAGVAQGTPPAVAGTAPAA